MLLAVCACGSTDCYIIYPCFQITVYKNGHWTGATGVSVLEETCSSPDNGALVPAFVCREMGIKDGKCTVSAEDI
jgi:hypothetical protein